MYTEESIEILDEAIKEANEYINKVDNESIYEHEVLEHIYKIEEAMENLVEETKNIPTPEPTEPEEVDPTPEPTQPKQPIEADIGSKDNLPATGSVSLVYPAMILVGLGIIVKLVSKKRE